jgi:hypothetical protein
VGGLPFRSGVADEAELESEEHPSIETAAITTVAAKANDLRFNLEASLWPQALDNPFAG